ncbi:histidine kinase [Paenibacillus sp. alder61]|uniref:sensor histidine kinase n=1 Tax=Paenibacillus sp. alder61 TaxID=2862948 RepID=UPI001CD451ED|nr:histidine kinase [Paenibacillus sp. alder61]MCA1295366.1 histidine kinase [Paenibacillus sp. alder61]
MNWNWISAIFNRLSLKHRLFISILLFVLIPATIVQIHSITRLETMMKDNIAEQNIGQLDSLKNSLENLRLGVLGSMLQLERDPEVVRMLRTPGDMKEEDRRLFLQNRLLSVKQGLMNAVIPVNITLADLSGHVYTSLEEGTERMEAAEINPNGSSEATDSLFDGGTFRRLLSTEEPYFWTVHAPEDRYESTFPPSELFSLYGKLQTPQGDTFGYIRISLDIKSWMNSITGGFLIKQNYYLLDGQGKPILLEADESEANRLQTMLPAFKKNPSRYFTDAQDQYMYNGVYMPNMNWYMLNRFPLEALSGNVWSMKRQVIFSFLLTVIVFMLVTYAIVSSILRPLRQLQRKMTQMADQYMHLHLQESKYKGETRELARSFNQMTDDIRKLIATLRAEERQKEALRFQILMSQMNPHFLLNTLNTLKWNARSQGDAGTYEICQNLGRLLECGLNTEVDLVHLKEEIRLVESYLYIQSFRYDHTFQSEIEMEEGLDYALIPKLSLQPLVENSLHHGLIHMREGGRIFIRVAKESRKLRVEILDNGQGPAATEAMRPPGRRRGIGISNLKERLALLYKGEASLELVPANPGMLAALEIPLLISSPYDKEEARHVEYPAR